MLQMGAAIAFVSSGVRRVSADEYPSDPTAGCNVAFEDDFQSIDWTHWNAGPKATTAPTGFYGRSAFAKQGGDAGFDPYSIVDDPNAQNGKALQIAAKYIGQKMNIHNYYGNDLPEYQWVSGNLQGATKTGVVLNGWRFGYFEARMQFPRHPLTWPAFWLLNKASILTPQTCNEVDIVEQKGAEPNQYGIYLHEWGQPGEHHNSTGNKTAEDLTAGYNLYGMLIQGNVFIPYFNRKPVLSQTGSPIAWTFGRSDIMDQTNDVFFPLLTLALSADIPYPTNMPPEDLFTRMLVDYVRIYQKA